MNTAMNTTTSETKWRVWLRIPPKRRWECVAIADSEEQANVKKEALVKTLKSFDSCIVRDGIDPNRRI